MEQTTEFIEELPWNQITFPKLGWEFEITSEAFRIGELSIKWYGLIIAVGLMLAAVYCFSRMKDFGLDGDRVIDAAFVGLVGAIICGRAYYIMFNLEHYKDIKDIVNLRKGGMAIYGALIGAVIFGCIVARLRKVRIKPLLDIASMGFLIGQGIGRWGNFFNHEAFGTNTSLPWGMSSGRIQDYILRNADSIYEKTGLVVDPYVPVHPCFLYESLWCLAGIIILHFYYKKRKYDGEVFLMYVCWYGFERMIVEGLRTDSLYIGNIRVSQMLAAIFFTVSLIMLVVNRIRIKKNGAPVLYVNTEESKRLLKEAEDAVREEEERRKAKKKGAELTAAQKIIDDEESEQSENNNTQEE
ncbi:MAG: prolipoprotein diacylglyceryl transferase [Oscillospiraceae bacterium]|nr:prolipoprotein diacylglyceryl transferase [Oscillospiraceae bacterium]